MATKLAAVGWGGEEGAAEAALGFALSSAARRGGGGGGSYSGVEDNEMGRSRMALRERVDKEVQRG